MTAAQVRERLYRGKMEHEAHAQQMVQQQNQLAEQVRAYHQTLREAMRQVRHGQQMQPLAVA